MTNYTINGIKNCGEIHIFYKDKDVHILVRYRKRRRLYS